MLPIVAHIDYKCRMHFINELYLELGALKNSSMLFLCCYHYYFPHMFLLQKFTSPWGFVKGHYGNCEMILTFQGRFRDSQTCKITPAESNSWNALTITQ